jgi:hypothetical protein
VGTGFDHLFFGMINGKCINPEDIPGIGGILSHDHLQSDQNSREKARERDWSFSMLVLRKRGFWLQDLLDFHSHSGSLCQGVLFSQLEFQEYKGQI